MPKGVYPRTKQDKIVKSIAGKKFHREHPGATKKWLNSPEIFELTQQYGYLLVSRLRRKYHSVNYRCNNPRCNVYEHYGGRGIENRFLSLLDFLNYVIFELGIVAFEQIDGLWIDRIDNSGNYEPGKSDLLPVR